MKENKPGRINPEVKSRYIYVRTSGLIDKAKRQKQIEKDLAYLDQLFPKDKKKASAKQKEVSVEAIAQETQKPEDILKELETAPVQEEVQKKVIDKIAIKKKSPEQKTILNSSKSNQWVRSLKNNKQKSPSDELKNYQTGDSSELITPLLTFASFIYFFYVLYI
ncbi:hypothetical protein MJH12_05650 [bacterium]|nr:hypothetical protein [bacterium]